MRRISFAWTTAALLAGAKTCTRRSWNRDYAIWFQEGEHVEAWDKLPYAGGKIVGTVKLTVKPYLEVIGLAPEDDYEAEGLAWMERQGLRIQGLSPRTFWQEWKASGEEVYVVRFKWLGPGRRVG